MEHCISHQLKFHSLALLAVLLLGACGGKQSLHDAGTAAEPVPGAPAAANLPFPTDHAASALVMARNGSDAYLYGGGAAPDGTLMRLDAGSSGTQFAAYSLTPLPGVAQLIVATPDALPPTQYWVGLADFPRQRWEISGPHTDSAEPLAITPARHLSPLGNLYAVVIVPAGEQAVIDFLEAVDGGPPNDLPNAALADPGDTSGPYPADIALDAGGSSDSDGSLVLYEWDFDGDYVFEASSGSNPQTTFPVPQAGAYSLMVRVTDDRGGTDVAQQSFSAHGWRTITVATDADSGEACSLAEINGHPAISYRYVDGAGGEHVNFAFSNHPLGNSAWQNLTVKSGPNAGLSTSLAEVNGAPAIALCADNPLHLHYARAGTPDGYFQADWTVLQASPFSNVGNHNSLALIGGNPAISYYCGNTTNVWYIRSSTPGGMAGGDWSAPVSVDGDGAGVDMGYDTSLAEVDGRPAIGYRAATGGNQLRYARSSNGTGTGPGAWVLKFTLDGNASFAPCLRVVDGCPAIAYWSSAGDDLVYARASTAAGEGLGDWSFIGIGSAAASTGSFPSLALIGGLPAIAHLGQGAGGGLLYAQSSSAGGGSAADWPANSAPVDPSADPASRCSLTSISGLPAVAYYDAGPQDLKYALLY